MMLPQGLMHAMMLEMPGQPLVLRAVPIPVPADGQVLVKVIACGVCRTDLHIVDGELPAPKLPLIPGHEIVGVVEQKGKGITTLHEGDRVGIPWLGYTCGTCRYCLRGQENLCEQARFTGYTLDGGFAEYTVAYEPYCFPLPDGYANASGSPLLCAGLIGYRSYSFTGRQAVNLGIYGFGAAAHLLIQLARWENKNVFAFVKEGDREAQDFALSLGAAWSGSSAQLPPEKLDAAIIFAPVGNLVPQALKAVDKGGIVVCGGIHMSDIPSFPYHLLWEERIVRSVANLTRQDGETYLQLAPQVPVKTTTTSYPLHQANEALNDLRNGRLRGAAVLEMDAM